MKVNCIAMIRCVLIVFLFNILLNTSGQPVPAEEENIPYLMTFGPEASTKWGDDDYAQIFFFLVPKHFSMPLFIRIYDPDVGGQIDEANGDFNTTMSYSIYGGQGAYSNKDAQSPEPTGNYNSGNLLDARTFRNDGQFDEKWFTFGPFNPTEGEFIKKFDGYIFKIIVQGESGDDGNLYRFFLSTQMNENKRIEGANAFAYEYSFRMHNDPNEVSHIYPYIDDKTISVKQSNFDWDNDGHIRIVSVARRGTFVKASGDNEWVTTEFKIKEEEKGTSLDFQFIKNKTTPIKNNNVVIYVTNQYGELLPFYTIPIGGVPKYKYQIGVKRK